jgi:hypothetical protein
LVHQSKLLFCTSSNKSSPSEQQNRIKLLAEKLRADNHYPGFFQDIFELAKLHHSQKKFEECEATLEKLISSQAKLEKDFDSLSKDQYLFSVAKWCLQEFNDREFLLRTALKLSEISLQSKMEKNTLFELVIKQKSKVTFKAESLFKEIGSFKK